HGEKGAVNPEQHGTKAALHHRLTVPAHGEARVSLRLLRLEEPVPNEPITSWVVRTLQGHSGTAAAADVVPFGREFEATVELRKREADEFYASLMPARASEDERNVIRQALAGMLWSKQYYSFDLAQWLEEHGHAPYNGKANGRVRNAQWMHMV